MPYKDPEEKRENSRKYYESNKEKKQEYNREYLKTNVEMSMWHSCKKRAKKRDLPFDLTIEDLEVPEKCPILGLELKAGNDSSREISPSLDRIVPELGYVKGNIRVISLRANRLKSDASIEELEAILKYMKEHERDSI